MSRKNVMIELLPRALWVLQGVCLYLGEYFTPGRPALTRNVPLLCVGIIFTAGGFVLFLYVGHYIRSAITSKELVTTGPFGYVRHPMYVSIYIMLFGAGLLFFSWTWFGIMAAFVPIWYADCRIEERQMIELHEKKYSDYKRKVGMFIPKRKTKRK